MTDPSAFVTHPTYDYATIGTFPKVVQDNMFAWHQRTERDPGEYFLYSPPFPFVRPFLASP